MAEVCMMAPAYEARYGSFHPAQARVGTHWRRNLKAQLQSVIRHRLGELSSGDLSYCVALI